MERTAPTLSRERTNSFQKGVLNQTWVEGRVVVVEHLDSLADGRDLLRAHLLALGPVRLLLSALRREVTDESLRLSGFLLRVLEVVCGLNLDQQCTSDASKTVSSFATTISS